MTTAAPKTTLPDRIAAAARAMSGRPKLVVRFTPNTPPPPPAGEAGRGCPDTLPLPPPASGSGDITLTLPTPSSNPESLRLTRAEADMVALSLRHHQAKIHAQHRPQLAKAAAIYDTLEAMRVQLAGTESLKGAAHNLGARMEHRYCEQGYDRFAERLDPPIADIASLMLRERVSGEKPPGFMRSLMDAWRPFVMLHGMQAFEKLATHIHDQQAFARTARELVRHLTSAMNEDKAEEKLEKEAAKTPEQPLEEESPEETGGKARAPSFARGEETRDSDGETETQAAFEEDCNEQEQGAQTGEDAWLPNRPEIDMLRDSVRYHAYTRRFDETVPAAKLAPPDEMARLRAQLDAKVEHLRGISGKLAAKLQRVLLAKQIRVWEHEQEEGVLHSARLPRAVADPNYPYLYKVLRESELRDTIVTLLLDNSGSMRGRPITIAAISADILARTLERCGVHVEILGFTTRDWKGGAARRAWQEEGRPANPGRLNDLRHIVYKSAQQRWQKARRNLGLMLKDGILKENIDGEAILWACERLLARPEKRRILMVISDGAPVDDSTLSVNDGNYLDRHLRDVIAWVENRTPVELLAIGIGHDVTRYYQHAVTLSDADQLGTVMVDELVKLFSGKK